MTMTTDGPATCYPSPARNDNDSAQDADHVLDPVTAMDEDNCRICHQGVMLYHLTIGWAVIQRGTISGFILSALVLKSPAREC